MPGQFGGNADLGAAERGRLQRRDRGKQVPLLLPSGSLERQLRGLREQGLLTPGQQGGQFRRIIGSGKDQKHTERVRGRIKLAGGLLTEHRQLPSPLIGQAVDGPLGPAADPFSPDRLDQPLFLQAAQLPVKRADPDAGPPVYLGEFGIPAQLMTMPRPAFRQEAQDHQTS